MNEAIGSHLYKSPMTAEEMQERVAGWIKDFAMSANLMRLAADLPGGTRTERVKRKAWVEGYNAALKSVHNAIASGQHLKGE